MQENRPEPCVITGPQTTNLQVFDELTVRNVKAPVSA